MRIPFSMPDNTPNHVAVIMDGNGRWAQARHMPRVEGHRRGMESLRALIRAARKEGVANLSVFAFSSENWRRPAAEVEALMRFFVTGLQREAEPLKEAGVKLRVIGEISAFNEKLQAAIKEAEEVTANERGMLLNVCANYSGRWDIAQAAAKASLTAEPVTAASLEKHLCMAESGPVDLMIRTGGESRISNFILWQSAYAELWFTERLWPDFSEDDFREALRWYSGRERRFGLTGDQVQAAKIKEK